MQHSHRCRRLLEGLAKALIRRHAVAGRRSQAGPELGIFCLERLQPMPKGFDVIRYHDRTQAAEKEAQQGSH
ncbi:hypothetical protein Pstr01_22430 [Pseudomonas straminea]|nr:hypothetical protein Pstr01_22430 [Pseudomonas straminea]